VEWPTRLARAVLPRSVSRADAVFNIGRTALVVDALQKGDLDLLQKVMQDRIHQSYRLKHIPGGMTAFKTAGQFGAAALSGAGPSIILFTAPEMAQAAITRIGSIFEERGIPVIRLITKPSDLGIQLI
jgi:homoserine kinase